MQTNANKAVCANTREGHMVRLSLRLRETYSLYSLPVSRRTLCHFELRRTMRTTGVRAGKSLQAGGKVWRFTDNGLGTDSSNPSSFGRESSNIQFLRRRLRPTALSIGARAKFPIPHGEVPCSRSLRRRHWATMSDSLLEGGGFELPVPRCVPTTDSAALMAPAGSIISGNWSTCRPTS